MTIRRHRGPLDVPIFTVSNHVEVVQLIDTTIDPDDNDNFYTMEEEPWLWDPDLGDR